MPGVAKSASLELLGLVVGVLLSGCGDATSSRPADLPGTMQTAARLTLGAHGVLEDETTPVELCLNPDGLCVASEYRTDECFRYDDMNVEVDGIVIPRVSAGGWSAVARFTPLPSGGNGYGCSYRDFESADLAARALSSTQELTIRIGNQASTATVADWLLDRTLSVPAALVKGTDVFVGVEPRVAVEERLGRPGTGFGRPATYFLHDDSRLNAEWFEAKGEFGPDATRSTVAISESLQSLGTTTGSCFACRRACRSVRVASGSARRGQLWR